MVAIMADSVIQLIYERLQLLTTKQKQTQQHFSSYEFRDDLVAVLTV